MQVDVRDAGLIPGSGRFLGGGHGNPLQYSRLENPMDREDWQATVHRITHSQTQLKRLSTQLAQSPSDIQDASCSVWEVWASTWGSLLTTLWAGSAQLTRPGDHLPHGKHVDTDIYTTRLIGFNLYMECKPNKGILFLQRRSSKNIQEALKKEEQWGGWVLSDVKTYYKASIGGSD